jgi:hypothetical protein
MTEGEMMGRRRSGEQQETQTCSRGLGQVSDSIRSHLVVVYYVIKARSPLAVALSLPKVTTPDTLPTLTHVVLPSIKLAYTTPPHRSPFRPILPISLSYLPISLFLST